MANTDRDIKIRQDSQYQSLQKTHIEGENILPVSFGMLPPNILLLTINYLKRLQ